MVTRKISPKLLKHSTYFTGPKGTVLIETVNQQTWDFCIPNPIAKDFKIQVSITMIEDIEPIIDIQFIKSFAKAKKLMSYVFAFVSKLKQKVLAKHDFQYPGLKTKLKLNCAELAGNYLIKLSQQNSYPEVFEFFRRPTTKDIPIITQLNLFVDEFGMIRVESKLKRLKAHYKERCPLLIDRKCKIATALINDAHIKLLHAGVYKILNFIRKDFWIPSIYSTVKKTLPKCMRCKRLFGRTIATNQNSYRSYRMNPEEIPYRNIIIDYVGPFKVKNNCNETEKTYILIISCYWSRAVNLLICDQLDTSSFLRALQIHIFDYGIPSLIVADNGTQIVQGLNMVKEILQQTEIKNFLKEENISMLNFEPYPSTKSELGAVIESLVKQVKILINNECM